MAYSDRELLARIVQCEAGGEGDNGMKAVATVTMNRVYSSEGEYARVSRRSEILGILFFNKGNLIVLEKQYEINIIHKIFTI